MKSETYSMKPQQVIETKLARTLSLTHYLSRFCILANVTYGVNRLAINVTASS